MKVSVVIPTRDGNRFLRPCLTALAQTRLPGDVELETIVVDNGSSESAAAVLAEFPAVKGLFFERSLGFAGANNAARGAARGDVVCFLNNDTRVDPDWLLRPLELLRADRQVSAVGSKLLFMHPFVPVRFHLPTGGRVLVGSTVFASDLDHKVRWSPDAGGEAATERGRGRWLPDGGAVYVPVPAEGIDRPPDAMPVVRLLAISAGSPPPEVSVGGMRKVAIGLLPAVVPLEDLRRFPTVRLVQNAGTFVSSTGEAGDVGAGIEDGPGRFDKEEVVPALCGAALLVRREALDAAGWFPRYYDMYYEDVDLSLRLRARGGKLVFCPASIVNHYHTGTNRELSPGFLENVSRSSLLFLSRYGAAREVGAALRRRIREARSELRTQRAGGTLRDAWTRAHQTRGSARALPALLPVLGERLRGRARSLAAPVPLLDPARTDYHPPAL